MKLTAAARRLLIALCAVAFAIGFAAPSSHATAPPARAVIDAPIAVQASDPVATPADGDDYVMNDDVTIDVNPTQLLFVTGLLLPVVVGLITKSRASSKLKALVNFAAAGVAAFLTNAVTEGGHAVFTLAQLQDWILVFAISTVTYLGLAKPTGTKLAHLAPNAGLGSTT